MKKSLILLLLFCFNLAHAQNFENQIQEKENEKVQLQNELNSIQDELAELKLSKINNDLKKIGLPSENYIEHSGFILEYSERHEQAKWTAHMVLPEIKDGLVSRTNDFRVDPLITTGTAVQEDYFLTDTLSDGKVEYDGFGYDRGHLVPSADFRWNAKALSETYYYSNMSPQTEAFNRNLWADIENHIRNYVIKHNVPVYILTIPVLDENLKFIDRSINKVSVPLIFAKAIYDPVNHRAMGFLVPNAQSFDQQIDYYAKSINELEDLLDIDLFSSIDESIEEKLVLKDWFENLNTGDITPLFQPDLPPNHFNTVLANRMVGKDCIVCGTVVSTRKSRSGNLWLSIDKQFPNEVFKILIKKDNIVHFPTDITATALNKKMCFKGKIEKFMDQPSLTISKEYEMWELNTKK